MLPLIDRIPEVQTLIGVIFAVTGNILISIALNLQKHAHNELRRIDYDSVAFNDTCDESNLQYSTSLYDSDPSIHEQSSNIDDDYVILSGFDDYDKPHYLHSKAWWAGILLMITGELGNFIAYAYAPASVVAPLGTVALISNVILAPIMLKERFRTQDLIGVIIAIIGAVVVVFNSKSGEVKLSPEAILAAILQMKFRIYLLITSILTLCLLFASNKYGHKLIFIDLSLVAIFGGYTVLATKSISSLLTETFISMFADPLTYLLFFVLLSTAVLQVKYFNKSLSQFDSTEVIPTQFVLFTISAVIGSAVLYNDFANMDVWKCAGFLIGCLLTFLGVFLVTSNRSQTRGYALISKNPTPAPLSSPIAAITEDDSVYNSPIEINRRLSPNTYRQISTNSPYRHALIESNVNIATPLLHGELYPANYHHHSRNDNGIFRSLVDVSATTITGVGQALNSVGTHHSHALGLDRVIENYSLKIKEERNRLNNNTGSNSNNINSNNNINDDHHHSYSFPVANGAFVYSSNDFNYLNSNNYSKGNVGRNGYNSMIPNNIDVNNFNAQVDNNRNRNNNKNGQSTNSLHVDISFVNSGHYNTGYNVESMGDDYKNYDGDGIKTPNNVIGISNGGGGLHYDENNDDDDDDDDDNSGDSYDVFSNGGDDYTGADLLDLPSSDNII